MRRGTHCMDSPCQAPPSLLFETGAGHGELVAALVIPQLLSRAFVAVADPAQAAQPSDNSNVRALAALGALASATAETRMPIQRALCHRCGVCSHVMCGIPLTMMTTNRL